MDLSELMADDAATKAVRAPSADELKSASELANEQVRLELSYRGDVVQELAARDLTVPELEELLKLKKEALSLIREFKLPNLLDSIGMVEFKLKDGSVVNVKEEIYTSIPEEKREAAFKWLRDTGNDGIIKNEFKLPFGKGQDEEAKELAALLSEKGFTYTNNISVHAQTLKAFVRKQMEAGDPVPTDVFSIHVKRISSIKTPKK